MKNVMYFYNGIQSEEELHDDEVADKLAKGQLMERAGEYWKMPSATQTPPTGSLNGLPFTLPATTAWRTTRAILILRLSLKKSPKPEKHIQSDRKLSDWIVLSPPAGFSGLLPPPY
jgi:hypothetical protein